jgi:hypothetical protein
MEDCEIEDREKVVKKANKKLNEIDKLKKKSELTTEEREKISKELYYRNIVDPKSIVPEYSEKQKQQIEKKRLKKEKEAIREAEKKRLKKEKEAIREAEKQEREAEKKEREARKEAEKKEREARKEAEKKEREARIEAEKKEREARIEAEKEAKREAEKKALEIIIKLLSQNELKNEWIKTLSENNNNINKAFRLMSLKYHPDKNTNKIWAEEKQKELNTLKELEIKRQTKNKKK